jgi:uncharacterized membrane protein
MRYPLLQLNSIQTVLLTIWVLIMVSLPIVDWTLGWSVMMDAVILGVLVQIILVIVLLGSTWGRSKTLRFVVLVILISWLAEALGTRYGGIFGDFSYTSSLQPQLLDVPVLIPLAWLMMLLPSWAAAQALANRFARRWQFLAFIVFSALAMTAWDLFIEPQMVAWGFWVWEQSGGYFGIPWSNFAGWIMVSAMITLIVRPQNIPTTPFLWMYTIMWLLQTAGLVLFWGMPGPGIVGGIFMGIIAILAWHAHLEESQ